MLMNVKFRFCYMRVYYFMNAIEITDIQYMYVHKDRDLGTYMKRNTGTTRGTSNCEDKERFREETHGARKGLPFGGEWSEQTTGSNI